MPATKQELTAIAQYELAAGADKHVEGMKGFREYSLKLLPKSQAILVNRYIAIKNSQIDIVTEGYQKEGQ